MFQQTKDWAARVSPWLLALLAMTATNGMGSTLVLKNGGRISGEITNPKEQPRKNFLIRTSLGATVSIPADRVREVLDPKNALPRYEEFLGKMPATAEGNWQMAAWCGKEEIKLDAEREHHLRKVIELEPNHELARAALGYKKNAAGAWENPDAKWISIGYVKVNSRYKSPQEIELANELERYETAREARRDEIRALHQKVLRGKNADQELNRLRALEDPLALDIIVADYLTAARGNTPKNHLPTPELKKTYIGIVAKALTYSSVKALVQIAITEPNDNLRDFTVQQLVQAKHPATTPALLSHIQEGLKNGDQVAVDRAARALGKLKAVEAVFPLIAALEMKLRTRVGGGGGGGIGASPTFDSAGNAGLSAGGKEHIVETTIQNAGVLDALQQITKVNFEYNRQLWKEWYVKTHTPAAVSLRRDE